MKTSSFFIHAVLLCAVVVAACGKTAKDAAPSPPPQPLFDSCRTAECVTAIPCRKHDCSGTTFWNGCCPCPDDTVNAFTCDGGP